MHQPASGADRWSLKRRNINQHCFAPSNNQHCFNVSLYQHCFALMPITNTRQYMFEDPFDKYFFTRNCQGASNASWQCCDRKHHNGHFLLRSLVQCTLVQPINTIDSINCLSITLPAPGEGRLDRYIVITTLDAPQWGFPVLTQPSVSIVSKQQKLLQCEDGT